MTEDFEIPHPRTASRLVGHSKASATLAGQLAGGRPHHAWLLSGPRGIGKATFAYTAAKAVLTGAAFTSIGGLPGGDRDAFNHAQDHPVAGQISQGAASSLFVYERRPDPRSGKLRSQIDVEQVREIAARFHLHTADGGWRVAIVDCLNDLNPSSANALLKLLEEPPDKSLFLLISHTGGFVLPTLRSRCLALHLKPLPDLEFREVLAPLAAQSGASDEDLSLIYRLAEGSAGRAVEMLAAGAPALYLEMMGLLGDLPAQNDEKLHRLSGKLARSKESPEYSTFAALLGDWLAKVAKLAARQGQAPDAAYVPGEAEILSRLMPAVGVDRWSGLWEKTVELFRRAEIRNLDRKQTLLNVFYGLRQGLQS